MTVRRLAATLALAALFVLPAGALAQDPSARSSPDPAASDTPAATPTAPLDPLPSTRPVPITVPAGQLGALVAPIPVIFTGPGENGCTFRVDNPSSLAQEFTIEAADYTIDAAGEPARDPDGNLTTDVPGYAYASADWYTFPIDRFILPAGSGVDLRCDINTPATALPGDHIAALVVTFRRAESEGPRPSAGAGLVASGRILTRLQRRVAGAVPGIPDISLNVTTDTSGIHFLASVTNTGTTVLDYKTARADDPLPQFRIFKAGSTEQVGCVIVEGGFYVLPEGNRIVTGDWLDPDAGPTPDPSASLTPAPETQGPCPEAALPPTGDYKAVLWLPARDGREEVNVEAPFSFVNLERAAPADYTMLIIAGILGVLLIASIVVGFFLLGSRRRRADDEGQELR